MDYQLVVVRGRSANQVLRLSNGITTVGRHEDCGLRIAASQVSRKHCELFEKKGLLVVKDLGSSNGTYVNGKKIEGQRVLEPGDILSFGKVRFRVEKAGASPGKPTVKASDTAVGAAQMPMDDSGDDEEFEIDFDEGSEEHEQVAIDEASAAEASAAEAEAEVTIDEEAEVTIDEEAESPTTMIPAAKEEPAAKPAKKEPEIGEDAVADFLLNIDLDEEDKR